MGRGIMPVSRRGCWLRACLLVGSFVVLTFCWTTCVGVAFRFSGLFVLWGNFTNVPSPVSRSVPMGNGVGRWVATTTIPSRCGVVAMGSGAVSGGGVGWVLMFCGVFLLLSVCVPTNSVIVSFFCRWQIDHHLPWRSWQHVFLKFCRGHQWKI